MSHLLRTICRLVYLALVPMVSRTMSRIPGSDERKTCMSSLDSGDSEHPGRLNLLFNNGILSLPETLMSSTQLWQVSD